MIPQRSRSLEAEPKELIWLKQDPHTNYKVDRELGRGKFGSVSLATCLRTGRNFAVKSISKHQPDFDMAVVRREIEILNIVSAHPNIAGIHEVYEDGSFVYVVMEPAMGGELFDLIVDRGFFTERDAAIVTRTLLQLVEYCHARGILHRDLKPENLLLKSRDAPIDKDNLRAVDFGLSTFFQDGQTCKEVVGSAYYLAPEVLHGAYGWEADLWSVGVILYIMLSGMPPFWGRTDGEIFDRVLNEPVDLKIEPWPEVSQQGKELVAKLLQRDRRKRMTVQQALAHPWIKGHAQLPDKPLSSIMLTRLKQFTQMSKLKCYMLNLVAKHLNPTEIGSLRESFMAMDHDGSGYITVDELRKGLSRCSVDPRATDVERLVTHMDARNGGRGGALRYEEFVAAALDAQRTLTAQTLSNIFSQLDVDGDGFLSAEELQRGLRDCDIFANVEDICQLMEEHAIDSEERERHLISAQSFQEIVLQSGQGEVQVAQLEGAVKQITKFAQGSRFKQLASLVVARTTPPEELAAMRHLFESLDTDHSGTISYAKLHKGLDEKCHMAHEEIARIMKTLDVRQDGEIDYDEFVASVAAEQSKLTDAKLQVAFDYMDADSDGVVSKDDLRRMLSELAIEQEDEATLMEMAGKTGDGVISFDEFKTLMHATSRPNPITRVSMMAPGMAPGPAALPNIAEDTSAPMDIESPTRPTGKSLSRNGMSFRATTTMATSPPIAASPVSSLMTAMEAKWMSGRMPSLPRAISKAIHVPFKKRHTAAAH